MKESVGAFPAAEEAEIQCEHPALAVRANLDAVLKLARPQPQALVGGSGVSTSQFMILCAIHREPGLRINDIARRRAIRPSTASNLVDKMEARGWVRRKRSRRDQRVVQIFITRGGREALQRFPATGRGLEACALALVPDPMLLALNRHLEVVISSLKLIRTRAARPGHADRSRSARVRRR